MPPTFEDKLRTALPNHVTLTGPLKGGGQGAVFLGTCRGQAAAIKAYNSSTDTRRVDRECKVLAEIRCPHVVRVLDHFSVTIDTQTLRIVVYEYHSGGDLSSLLQANAPTVAENDLVAIGLQVSTGITTLWAKRIVHRDIKPPNIVRANDGRCVLVDIGFARHIDLSDITGAGGSPGTTGFRSPEQFTGRKSLTIHSDVYSLGVTLYLLAAKRHPFGGSDLALPTSIDVRPLTARPLSSPLVRLILQMLDFTPAKRPADVVARFSVLGGP